MHNGSINMFPNGELHVHWSKLTLVLIPLITILGNMLVILSVIKFKSLQTAINFLIFGLAFADLFVAVFVMPYAVYIELSGGMWHLGDLVCNIYSATDVACSTASILILAVISFDRYRAVTKPISYSRKTQNISQVFYTLGGIWSISIALASPIVLGANSRPAKESPYECRFYNPHFLIFSSIISFVIPCFVVLFVYSRILQELRKRERAAKLRHSSNTNQMSMQSSCATSCDSTLSLEDPSRLNASTDETALYTNSESQLPSTTVKPLSSRTVFEFFRNWVPYDNFRQRFRRLYANNHFGFENKKEKKYSNAAGGESILTFAMSDQNDGDFEFSPSTIDSDTPSLSFSNCSIFDNPNAFTSCPCSQALIYGLSVHRVRDSDDETSLSTIIVPHSQFYRFCRALTKTAASKHIDNEVSQDSNGSTVSKSADNNFKMKSEPYAQVASPVVTFNVMVHEESVNSNRPACKTQLDEQETRSNKMIAMERLKSCYETESSSVDCQESKSRSDTTCETLASRKHRKSESSSISALLKARLLRRGGSARKFNMKRKSAKLQRKERRATKTLGVVVGVFLLCWVPFFSMNILNAVCIILKVEACKVNFDVFFYCTWLGYMNSFMNPIIYTIFNAEFRRSFKAILHLDDIRKLSTSFS